VPAALRPTIEPLIPAIVGGIHNAFTIAVTSTFQVGVVTTILAFGAALMMEEIPLRSTMGEAPAPAPAKAEGAVAIDAPPRWTGSPSSD
jgi:hypothetical protein